MNILATLTQLSIIKQVGAAVTFQTCVFQVFGLNLGWDTNHNYRFFVNFFMPSTKIPVKYLN
jgi:hypothetical protein